MNVHKTILSSIFVIIILFLFINITYLNKNTSGEKNVSIKNDVGIFNVNKGEKNLIYLDNINNIDEVYFLTSSGGYNKNIDGNKINIEIKKGLYFFNIQDLKNEFTITNNSFLIQPKSIGKIYIDSRDDKQIKIFSFDNLFDLKLIDSTSGEKMTSLILYPHMYIGFNSGRNKFVKNADLLRLETLLNISYIKESKLNSIYQKIDDEILDFFTIITNNYFSKENINQGSLNNISLIKHKSIFGSHYIDKYFQLFLNKDKKVIYYKNNLILNLNKLFKKSSKNDLDIVKNNILQNLENIKNLNLDEFKNIGDILIIYYKKLLSINSLDYVDNTIVLIDIINKYNNIKIDKNISGNTFYLNKIYSLIDKGVYDKKNMGKNLLSYFNDYLLNSKIELDDNFLLLKNTQIKNGIIEFEYLSFFLKNILINDINYSSVDELENTLKIMNLYFSLNDSINLLSNNKKSETLIIEYNFLIDKFLTELRKVFFQEELTMRGLLIKNKENIISKKNLDKIDFTIKLFFNFFEKNKGLLSVKNFIYSDIYLENIKKYNEYYTALNDYGNYLIKYDSIKSSLLETKTIIDNTKKEDLSKEKLQEFLNSFEGLDLSNINTLIIKNEYYKIMNLYINGEKFSFDYYPYNFGRIDNIYQNGKKLTSSYELDSLKSDWDEAYKSAQEEEKNKYDFKRFFLNIFFSQEIFVDKTFKQNKIKEEEDILISIFKRDKLFGDRGDFSVVKGFLNIGFDDVEVKLVNDNYKIKIKKAILQYYLDKKNTQVIGELKADYVFSNKDHYFKNITLKFYDPNSYSRGQKFYLFSAKEFSIDKNIDILKFREEIKIIIGEIFE